MDEEIDLTLPSDGEESIHKEDATTREAHEDRRAILEPVVGAVVDALGGMENDVYVLGDDALGCLKDLRTLWRKDETDDERTVARLCWETRVLPNDLVPILLQTAGKGLVEDKRAIACADLITAMTWPIDLAEELKELDDVLDQEADYTQLLRSHLHYKAALLQPGVMQAMFGIMLPPLAKSHKDRKPRDGQIANVVLHLIRNLAFIKDLPYNAHLSSDQAEFSSLQSKFLRTLSETNMIDLILTIAANADKDPLFDSWNTLVLEILYLLFRGTSPSSLAIDASQQPKENLQRLLALEDRSRRETARKATSRHSRFGTTISVKLNPNRKQPGTPSGQDVPVIQGDDPSSSRSFILHRQAAIHTDSGAIMDMAKKQKAKKLNKVDDVATINNLSVEARRALQHLASEFLQACLNPFLSGILKDIRSERPKITDKDNLRLLFVAKWFLEFFQCMRTRDKDRKPDEDTWPFGLVAEVTERSWIVWVLKRMREATEEKPKLWTELQAGIECLTQLLLLIDKMSSAVITDEALREAADLLQQQLIYNGEVLDIALTSLKSYKPGTQSLAYLDSSVYLAYALLRMLERWSKEKGSDTYVRKKTTKKRRPRGTSGEEGIQDVEEVEEATDEDVVNETIFTFEAFEAKFAQSEVTHTLLVYLARYREFTSSENMRRVVNLLHRQAVKCKAEGLFFKVSTLDLFRKILADQKSLPRDQPYKDLINLINFILRQFFKALEAEPFLAVEAFFPKNRGTWKQYSSWTPEEAAKHDRETRANERKLPVEVQVKKGFSWSDQVGIAIANLVERNEEDLVKWTQEILTVVSAERNRIIRETDASSRVDSDVDDDEPLQAAKPSAQALAKIQDNIIPYVSDERAIAGTRNQYLKLLFELCKFARRDEDAGEVEWYVPAAVEPADLERSLKVITQFLEEPFDLQGKKASQLVRKRNKRRKRHVSSSVDDGDASDDEPQRKRKEKKKKEKETYKSAQFIEDSDAEYGDMDAFLEKEQLLRERMRLLSEASGSSRPPTMKPTGTKKRRKKRDIEGSATKRRKGTLEAAVEDPDSDPQTAGPAHPDDQASQDSDSAASEANFSQSARDITPPISRPRPRPVPKRKPAPSSSPPTSKTSSPPGSSPSSPLSEAEGVTTFRKQRTKRLVLSDDDGDD